MSDKYTLDDVRRDAGPDLTASLLRVVRAESIPTWFYQPNDAFEGKTPQELCLAGEHEKLEAMCHRLESGEPS